MKIPHNSLIKVNGWVMLKKIESIKYKIQLGNTLGVTGKDEGVYWFLKPKGRKPIIGHFAPDVDCWVNPENCPNNNRIVVLG